LQLRSTQPQRNRDQANEQQRKKSPIAGTGIKCGPQSVCRKPKIGIADSVQVDPRNDPADIVDNPANAIVGDAHQR